jgi:hypothetical protein
MLAKGLFGFMLNTLTFVDTAVRDFLDSQTEKFKYPFIHYNGYWCHTGTTALPDNHIMLWCDLIGAATIYIWMRSGIGKPRELKPMLNLDGLNLDGSSLVWTAKVSPSAESIPLATGA